MSFLLPQTDLIKAEQLKLGLLCSWLRLKSFLEALSQNWQVLQLWNPYIVSAGIDPSVT